MKILLSGATGLVGTKLTAALRAGSHTVAPLVRPGRTCAPGEIPWDPVTGSLDPAALEGADALVHLSGASVAEGRWTPARKQLLRSSRIDATRVLAATLARMPRKPRVLVCASACGIYGNRGDELLTESSAPGDDFLAALCREWEAAAAPAEQAGIRTVFARFGVILSLDGGALARMLPPFKLCLGGRLGSGKQWMSWIAMEDVLGFLRTAISDERYSGAFNVVAPNPVQNAEFTRVLADMLHRPAIFPAPPFALRLALGELADAMLLSSQRALPARAQSLGFAFRFNHIEPALRALILGRV
ncbi:MAG TPA: TIGR01777 family oxidoreductase [Candidatus Sulfotelmatobacter sp.]|nr:TIGR01777 family oxidoreductase [Candidatus Sulfotelmatobacter sp.]